MKIVTMKLSELTPADYNPRKQLKQGDDEYQKLNDSLNEFGLVEPLIWNEQTGNLVGGHQRLTVLINNGVEEVEVSVVSLPLEKEKMLNLALNKIQGDWDEQKLGQLLDELDREHGAALSISGFDTDEISDLIEDLENQSAENAEDLIEVQAIEPSITQKGDVIELGRNRLMCGRSESEEDLKTLMNGRQAALLHTDPPYGCAYDPAERTKEAKRESEKLENDDLPQPEYEAWLNAVFQNMRPHLSDGSPFYIWNGHKQFGPMHGMLTKLGTRISNVITWVKPNLCISFGDYKMQSEFCLYGWFPSEERHRWYGGLDETNVWELPRDSKSELVHSTQKPQLLVQRVLRNSSKRGDLVLDLFGGSGSTMIAAEKLGRICYTMETDPKYCDAIVKRYIKKFGKESVAEAVREKYAV